MKKSLQLQIVWGGAAVVFILWFGALPASAQRQMEHLGRGLLALHSSTSQAYVGWRLLGNDPQDIGFNLYRVANGGAAVKLNSTVITNVTSFLDTTATFTLTNSWYVRPVTNGVEGPASTAATLLPNAPVRQYIPLPLQPVIGGLKPPYDCNHCWPADLDGDGEFDFVVTRNGVGTNSVPAYQYAQACLRDGTLLWQLNAGPNSTNTYSYGPGSSIITGGDSQHMLAYDLDGDGKAEVIMKTSNGVTTVRPDGSTISSIVSANTAEFISIFDGLTGVEKARCVVTNPWPADGVMYGRLAIVYADGVHPTLIFPCENRNDSSGVFQECNVAFDYRDGVLTQRWFNIDTTTVARSHQLRQADVDHDGKDDLIEIGGVFRANDGSMLFDTDLVHGDRLQATDMDPERPGLETYAIQQNHSGLVATALYEAGTGRMIKRTYTATVADIGRGDSGDYDPRYLGVESFSTEAGMFDARGSRIPNVGHPFPTLSIWWDGDLRREFMSGAGSTLTAPTIDKWDQTAANPEGVNLRLYSIYNEGVHQGYAGRPPFIGDLFGDWREEVVLVADDYSQLRIYSTKNTTTNRLYCLMQNAAYRLMCLNRGYVQSPYTDYYLGEGMETPCPPPAMDSKLVWRGDAGNVWNTTTACWRTNWNYAINPGTNPVAYASGDSVLFELTGSNQTTVGLSGTLTPGAVTVYAPKDFTFAGSGSLAGGMTLTKVGGGKLTLSGTNTFTGVTTVWEGPLVVDGQLTASPVTVRGGVWLDGALAGHGTVSQRVTVNRYSSVSPGHGTNSPGTLTLSGGLLEKGGAFNRFDLSDAVSGKTNDLLVIHGNLTLTGNNAIVIHRLDGALQAGGVYPLITYTGLFYGSLANLEILGVPGVPVALTNPPGQIALVVKTYPAPATVTWTGGRSGNTWDLLGATNWFDGAGLRPFVPLDQVRFDHTGGTNLVVTLAGDLTPASVVVDSTSNYTFTGDGNLMGPVSFTKTNHGTLTLLAANHTFTGPTRIAGGTLEVLKLDSTGFPSPLGNPPGGSTNLIFSGNSTLRVLGESFTDRGMTLNAGTNTLEVPNSADQTTVSGQVTGAGLLRVLGPGTVALTVSNSYSGGTIIRNGRLALGSVAGNVYGLGTGLVTLDGGRLSMMNLQASEAAAWNLRCLPGTTNQLDVDGRCSLTGSLTGGGTFIVNSTYVRTDFAGNWSAYTGAVKVAGSGTTFRWANSSGLAQARLDLGSGVSLHCRVSGTPTVSLGELSGAATATINATGSNDGLPVRWSVGGLNTSATYAGTTANNVAFTKTGAGTWTWSGVLAHTGSTIVNGGTLLVNGNAVAATNTYTVNSGGTLGGTGVIGGVVMVNNGGALAAGGTNVGTLTLSKRLVLNATSQLPFQLGAVSDLVNVSSNLTLGGQLQITNAGGFVAGTYILFHYGGTLAGTLPTVVSTPAGYTCTVDTNTPGQVRLVAAYAGTIPTAPLLLTATASNAAVLLTWTSVNNATKYNLKRSLTQGGPFSVIAAETAVTNFTDTAVVNGTTYYYVVTAVNGAGESGLSPQAAAMPPGIPDVPTGLVAAPGDRLVSLDWNPAPWATSYNVKSATTNGGPYLTLATNVTGLSFDAMSLLNGTNYYFVVSAVNVNGESAHSAPASAIPVPPVVAYWTNRITSAAQNWNTHANWTNVASFPDALGVGAEMNADIAANQTINLNTNVTLGRLQLGDANGTHAYTLAANGGELVFDNGASPAKLVEVATSKGDTLSAPIRLNSSLVVSNLSTNTLTFREPIAGVSAGVTFAGGRISLVTNNTFGGDTLLNESTVVLGSTTANVSGFSTGKVTLSDATLQLYGYNASTSPDYGNFDNPVEVPAGKSGTVLTPPRYTWSGALSGAGMFHLRVDYVRGGMNGNWSAFAGQINVTANGGGPDDFRILTATGFPNARLWLGTNVSMYSLAASQSVVPIGEFSAQPGATVGVNSYLVTWRVGALNTDATNAATITGTTRLLKEGTGTWTLTGDNSQTGTTTVSNGTLYLNNPLGSPTGSGALTVAAAGTLSGNAQIDGPATIEGTLAPGTGSHTLLFNSGLTLGSEAVTVLKVRRVPGLSDLVGVTGSLVCGGTLVVTNIGTNDFGAGDTVTPFTASAIRGSFASLVLPPLADGLAWDDSALYTGGTLSVVTLPPTTPPSRYQTTLAFSGYDRSELLTNLPLLVTFSTNIPGFSYEQFLTTNGSDLRFVSLDGATRLNHEIDSWNPDGESRVWVQVPVFSNQVAIVAWWGDALATNSPPATSNGATWTGGYVGVWHFTDTNAADSTARGHDAATHSAAAVAGLMGGALSFDGIANQVVVPYHADFNLPNNFEVQGWFNVAPADKPASGNYLSLTTCEISYLNRNWWVAMRSNGSLEWKSGSGIDLTNVVDLADGNWHHFAAVHEGGVARLYVDGLPVAAKVSPGNAGTPVAPVYFGTENGARYFKGSLDEMRLANVARSSNWVWAVYQNIAANRTCNSFSVVAGINATNPPPTLDSFRFASGQPVFQIGGLAGYNYVVQASTNLVTWTDLLSTNPVALPFLWTDAQATNYFQRFYRVLIAP